MGVDTLNTTPAAQEQESGIQKPDKAPIKPALSDAQKKKNKRKKIKLIIIIAVIVLVVAAIVFGMFKLFEPKKTEMATTAVYRGMLENTVTGNATAMPAKRSDVVTSATGEVQEIFVKDGDKVEEGALLFTVDTTKLAEELAEAEDKMNRAQDDLNKAQKKVDNLGVKAPATGKTIDISIKKGDYVSENTKIGTLFDDSRMRLNLYFSYAYVDVIQPGMAATVSIPQSMNSVAGTVASVEKIKKVSPEGTVLFLVEIIMDNPGALANDMIATASVTTDAGEVMPAESGKLEYNELVDILAKSSGTVEELVMKDYYAFNEGDVVCRLSNDTLGTEINAAQKEYVQARDAYNTLLEKQGEYEVHAPIAGTVMSVAVKQGDQLDGSAKVAMSVADLSSMVVNMQIDERDIGKLSLGMMAEVTMDNYDGQMQFMGEITSLSMEGKAENGVSFFPGEITITDSQNSGLMTGMYVQYRIVTTQKDNVLIIPSSAAVYTENGVVAFVKKGTPGADEKAIDVGEGIVPEGFIAVPIEIGEGSDQQVEVISGLEEGWEISTNTSQDDMGMMGGMVFYG